MSNSISIQERKKATEKETKEFIERARRKYREFVLTLNNGIEKKGECWLGEG